MRSFFPKGAIFDLDGTLFISPYNWAEIKRKLGVRGKLILDHLYSLPEPEKGKMFELLDRLEEEAVKKGVPAPGAVEVLKELRKKGLKLGVLTNNSARLANKVITKLGFTFDSVITRDSGVYKPYPEAIEKILFALSLQSKDCLYIGDNWLDLETVKPFNFKMVLIVSRDEELRKKYREKAVYLSSLQEILDILNGKI